MKKQMSALSVFLCLFLLINSVGAQAAGTARVSVYTYESEVFKEGFEDWTVGSYESGAFVEYVIARGWKYDWLEAAGNLSVPMVVTSSLLKDTRSLKFFGNRTNLLSHDINISSQTTRLVLEVVLKIDRIFDLDLSATVLGIAESHYVTKGNFMELARGKFSDAPDTMVIFAGDEFVMLSETRICRFSTNTWYTVKMIYDLSTVSTSIFLDEKLLLEKKLETSITGTLDLCFFVFSYGQTIFLDSVRIFELSTPYVSLILNPGEGGTTSPTPQTMVLEKGSSITIWALSDEGYIFDHWICNNTYYLTANPLYIEMNECLSLTPFFSKKQPFYSESWFWSMLLPIAAIATSVFCYIWFKRKTQWLIASEKRRGEELRPLICPKCGCNLPKGAAFCGNCGFRLDSESRKK
jgi:hypothetical protein